MIKPAYKFLAGSILALLLSACATAYQPLSQTGGFYQRKISQNSYMIGFNGNEFTSSERVSDFALLRAAELGAKLGYRYFVLDDTQDNSHTEIVDLGTTTTTSGRIAERKNVTSFQTQSTTSKNRYKVFKPGVEMLVVFADKLPTAKHLEVYEVGEVVRQMREKYDIKP
jgi:hypothetical protein